MACCLHFLRFILAMLLSLLAVPDEPPTPRAEPPLALELHRCTTVAARDLEHATCPHSHAGVHFLAREDADVSLLDNHTVRIVEPCASLLEHAHETPGTYILWFVARAPSQAQGTQQPCPSAAPPVSHPYPYALPTYPAGTPNPNNPDPTGTYDIVTRHWAEASVHYSVNIPTGAFPTTPIFPTTTNYPWTVGYTFGSFDGDIQSIMRTVDVHANIGITPVWDGLTSTNWEAAALANPWGAALPTLVGNFIWDFNCGGPTGDGVNEFIFLRSPHRIAATGSATAAAGLTSTLMDVSTGQIIECDVVFQAGSPASWGSLGPQYSTAFAHEIGHFFGLDHTNLHPGGAAAATPPPLPAPGTGTLIAFASNSDIPAMTGQYIVDDTAGRVGGTLASPWKSDDLAGLASLYPVQSLTSTKRHLVNDCASITGSVVDTAGKGLYALNVYLIPMLAPTSTAPYLMPASGSPVVGTICGTARLGLNDVTGLQDTILIRSSSGQFRIDGIPVPSNGSPARYAVVVEPMTFINIPQSSFAEWWTEGSINATGLNTWPPHQLTIPMYLGNSPDALINDYGYNTLGTGGTVQVGSIDMVAGTVINLARPIIAGASQQVEIVSRPLVQIPLSARRTNPQGGVVPVTVHHNYGTNPLTVSAVLNGVALAMTNVPTTGGPDGVNAWTSIYNVTMPATIYSGSVFQFRATEMSGSAGGAHTVTGMGEARY